MLRCRALTGARVGVGLWLSAPPAATWYREEALEEGVEGGEVLVRFDQSGAQGEAQQLAVMHAHQADAVQGIQALSHRETQALRAQQPDEGDQARRHRPASRRARAMSSLSFRRMLSVSTINSRERTLAPKTTSARAQSSVSLMLGGLRRLSWRTLCTGCTMCVGRRLSIPGTLRCTIWSSAAAVGWSMYK